MLAASWASCGWCLRWFEVAPKADARAVMGGVAFALLMAAELAVSVLLFGQTASSAPIERHQARSASLPKWRSGSCRSCALALVQGRGLASAMALLASKAVGSSREPSGIFRGVAGSDALAGRRARGHAVAAERDCGGRRTPVGEYRSILGSRSMTPRHLRAGRAMVGTRAPWCGESGAVVPRQPVAIAPSGLLRVAADRAKQGGQRTFPFITLARSSEDCSGSPCTAPSTVTILTAAADEA